MNFRQTACLAALASLFTIQSAVAADLKIDILNVPTKPGKVMIAVFDSAQNLRKRPVAQQAIVSTPGKMSASFSLPAGEYAVMAYHDQNGDAELNTNMLGIPKEPWAASLNTRLVIGPPTWDQVRFGLSDQGDTVKVDFE